MMSIKFNSAFPQIDTSEYEKSHHQIRFLLAARTAQPGCRKADEVTDKAIQSMNRVIETQLLLGQVQKEGHFDPLAKEEGSQLRLNPEKLLNIELPELKAIYLLLGKLNDTQLISDDSYRLIRKLDYVLLKCAYLNPMGILNPNHVCQKLIASLLQFAMIWSATPNVTESVTQKIAQMTESSLKLNAPMDNYQHLENANQQIENYLLTLNKRFLILQKRLLDTEKGKLRKAQAERISNEIVGRYVSSKVFPDFISDYIKNSWHNVLTLEILRHFDSLDLQSIHELPTILFLKKLVIGVKPVAEPEALEMLKKIHLLIQNDIKPIIANHQQLELESKTFIPQLDSLLQSVQESSSRAISKLLSGDIIRLKPVNDDQLASKPLSFEQWQDHVFELTEIDFDLPRECFAYNRFYQELPDDLAQSIPGDIPMENWYRLASADGTHPLHLSFVSMPVKNFYLISADTKEMQILSGQKLVQQVRNRSVILLNPDKHLKSVINSIMMIAVEIHVANIGHYRQQVIQATAAKKADDERKRLEAERQKKLKQKNEALNNVLSLKIGDWIALELDEGLLQCQVSSKNKISGTMSFINKDGIKVLQQDLTRLAELLLEGKLNVIASGDRFDQALTQLINRTRDLKSKD